MNNVNLESSSNNKGAAKNEANLIVLNKFQKIKYFGPFELNINASEKWLTFKTTIQGSQQDIESTFDRVFIQQNNFLCVLNNISNNTFVMIFPNKKQCDDIMNKINEVRLHMCRFPQNDPNSQTHLFKNNVFIPFLKEIQNNIVKYTTLKLMLVELVNSFDEKKQKLYIDIASEMGFQLIIDENERSSVAETEEGNLLAPPKNDKAEANSLYDRFIGGNHVNDHDSVISASEQSIIGRTPQRKRQRSIFTDRSDNADTPIFQVVTFFQNGALRKRLIIFSSPEKLYCHEFYNIPSSSDNYYVCKKCFNQKFTMPVKVIIEDGKHKLLFSDKQHICQLIPYSPEAYKSRAVVKSRNFELFEKEWRGKILKRMIIFNAENKDLCREYQMYGKRYCCYDCKINFHRCISAKVRENEDEKFVELSPVEHFCEFKQYKFVKV